jgi:hypothetical protein
MLEHSLVRLSTGAIVADRRSEVFQVTFDLVLLKRLDAIWLFDGYGIAWRIRHVSENTPLCHVGRIRIQDETAAWPQCGKDAPLCFDFIF